MNLDQDYDDDGNNIVPCPICNDIYCPSKEKGKCPEEDEFIKEVKSKNTMNIINKVYKINGGDNGNDYGVSSFEQKYKGMKVGDICEQLLGGNDSYEDEEDGFGIYREDPIEDVEQRIFMRMRDYMDYDDLKHEKLYLDFEVIK